MTEFFAWLVFAIWLYLVVARGGFWRARMREERDVPAPPAVWPAVVAVIPARDEAATVARTIASLAAQDYPGAFSLVLVDDGSRDGTGTIAREAAKKAGAPLTLIEGKALPPGWTGKVWALSQGIAAASEMRARPEYLLLTDADIVWGRQALKRLVARAEAGRLALVSVMARLHCGSLPERVIVPAFVYFFQLLYPFAWVNEARRRTAAAAGGCMLVRREALAQAGGIETIRDAVIDDCALARALKRVGPIWLGLSEEIRSIREYAGLGPLRRMVTRSAFAQLGYSPLRLAATIVMMALTFAGPPVLVLLGPFAQVPAALAAWALMTLSLQPMLRFYALSPLWGAALPLIAMLYMAWTVESALRHVRGRGGEWKGRLLAAPRDAR